MVRHRRGTLHREWRERSVDDILTFTPSPGFLGSDEVKLHMTYPMGGEATQELMLTWWAAEAQGFKLYLPVATRNI